MNHPSNKATVENIADLSHYHSPRPDMHPRFKAVADACETMLHVILENCPDCADRSTAIRVVREARMWANAAIALEPEA